MVRRKVAVALAALGTGVAASVLLVATPAQADTVCNLSSNAFQYQAVQASGGNTYEFTLHAGRGYHSYDIGVRDGQNRLWVYGYGAEHPGNTGWILASHVPNCL
jgi:hypothetical protein